MPAVAFVIPIKPGKTEVDRSAMESCWRGERRADHESSRERLGITSEAVWIQETPGGDVAVVHLEADDLEVAFQGMGTSEEPFDRWFREYVRDVHGLALEDGFPPPEQVLDYRSRAAVAQP
ncbi:MAG: hypothetical protein M3331_06470 [Actinomycetota bacterium]|nr:hypothetical protein [Actinomycetota bacterium]